MAATSPSPGDLFGHFRLIEQIGEGGMGIVYRARDERLQRDVAVKVLNAKNLADPSASKRFRREALILGRLNHPNVEAVYDFHSEHGLDYLVIEYIPGNSLDDRLHQGALPEKEVVSLGLQLARGLAAAHAQGIIHRDLKPGNLRVTPENVLKILDFGLAQLFAAPDARTLTGTATVTIETPGFAGTLAYMAPEQLQGQEPDTRSDNYSAGVVLYELATGTRAFPQRGQMLWDAILHSVPPAPRIKKADISPGLEAVILKCLEKDPTLRYQSAVELLADLEQVSAAQDVTASGQHSAAVELAAKPRKRRMSFILAAILLVAIASGILIWKRTWQPQMQQKILAVLPMDTPGQDPATSALGLGLTETVTAKLVQASVSDAVQVVSPQDLRDKGVKTAEDARREFGTDLVLESSLQRSGQTIRINCYLVDSRTHRQLAAKTIEAQVTDAFGLQDSVLSAALDMLPAQIKPEERRKLNVSQSTQPAAYDAYIRGRGYLQEYEKQENIDSAISEFERAIQIEPNYAPAYAGLGETFWMGYQQLNKGRVWLAKASENCEQAQALDPHFAEGHTCLGNVYYGTGQYEEAVKQYQQALDLDPNSDYALGQLALAYQKVDNPAAAEAAYKKAIALRPNYWGLYSGLGLIYYGQARYIDAAEAFRKVTILAPDNYRGYSNLGGIQLFLGQYTEAITSLKRSIELRPNRDAYTNLGAAYFALRRFSEAAENAEMSLKLDDTDPANWGNLGDALYWTPGRRPSAAAAYKKAIALLQSKLKINSRDSEALGYIAVYSAMLEDKKGAIENLKRALAVAPKDPEILFDAGFVYNHIGDTDRALASLEKAVAAGYSRFQIKDNPDFDRLKNNPKYQALVERN